MLTFKVKQRLRYRLRLSTNRCKFKLEQAVYLEEQLLTCSAINKVKVSERLGEILIIHNGDEKAVVKALKEVQNLDLNEAPKLSEYSPRLLNRHYQDKLIGDTIVYLGKKLLLPLPVQAVWSWIQSLKYIKEGIRLLLKRQLKVELLDAVAITASLLMKDYSTVGAVMYLLGIGKILEEWTIKQSTLNLAENMALHVDNVWVRENNVEFRKNLRDVKVGDFVVLRQGDIIPVDGVVTEGLVMVNQSSITGESLPVERTDGGMLYAGTVIEEGSCIMEVHSTSDTSRYKQIIHMIEESEQLKSQMEQRAYHMADKLVPASFLGMIVTYILTRNITKALAFIMVDFSCALKLSIPLAVLSAMNESSQRSITIKGGKFMEQIANADVMVFDKTGTLTKANPVFEKIIPFNGTDPDEMLALAACLEEHFPHSMARAVVDAAKQSNLVHIKEMHTKVNYVVAHGIESRVNRYRCRIGSAHFIFEDGKTLIPPEEQAKFDQLPDTYSYLYLAIRGVLSAVICITDPIREEAKSVIDDLHDLGIKKVIMMTGDSKHVAARVANELGIDEFYAEVLPSDKADYIKKLKEEGHTVMMVGDGINDAPALSEAHVGISMHEGAPIAQQVANVTISSSELDSIVYVRELSMKLMERINNSYRGIIGVNGALVGLGVFQAITPATAAWLHNAFTLGISLKNMRPLLSKA